MPRLQSLTQEHFEQRQMSPVTTKMIMGGAGGVPKMHPLKSSMPAIKAGTMIHGLRMRAGIRTSRAGMGMPKMGLPRLPKV